MQARFVSMEGGEGVGKSLFISGLAKELSARGVSLISTFEPGGTPTAAAIRQLFVNPPKEDPLVMEAEFFLISAARAQHVATKIKPALARGTWVLCDRFADSSRVYQGLIGGIATSVLEAMIGLSSYGIEPDLTFVLDCPPAVSMERLSKRADAVGASSRYDQKTMDFHEQVRSGFLQLAKQHPKRMIVLPAQGEASRVLETALAALEERGWI